MAVHESESCSVVSDSLQPHGLPWNSPGQNSGVGSLSLLQGIFPTQGSNPGLPHCGQILHQLSHEGSPVTREAQSLRIDFLLQETKDIQDYCWEINLIPPWVIICEKIHFLEIIRSINKFVSLQNANIKDSP